VLLTEQEKRALKDELVACLRGEREVRRIVVFGSFVRSNDPNDMDVAIFQDSGAGYLELAMKYRRMMRSLARRIPLDVIPLKAGVKDGVFLAEIAKGEVVYEG
jgi:uncharacterized protein